MLKKVLGVLIFLFIAANSFAGELISKEATNYYNEGIKLQKGANFIQADAFYQKTLLAAPANLRLKRNIINNRGVMLAKQGFVDEAEGFFLESLKIDPNYLPAKLNLGFIYEERRSELESIKYWLKVLEINLEDIKPKGFVLGALQETEESK